MGNLIKDFWTFQYKLKNTGEERQYYGMVEVVEGDLSLRSIENKRETHIKNALAYCMKHDVYSHMSIQTYISKMTGTRRAGNEEAFYPFTLELEPSVIEGKAPEAVFAREYRNAVEEAIRAINYIAYNYDFDVKNILILINNHRSIYLLFNPVAYGLKPRVDLHTVYRKMFEELNEEIEFKYADRSFYSHNKLMKTPNAYYCGGYVRQIEYEDLKDLYNSKNILKKRALLTGQKKSLDYYRTVTTSFGFSKLYQNACADSIEDYKENLKKEYTSCSSCSAACIRKIESIDRLEKGCRNDALVSIALYYRDRNYTEREILDKILKLAEKWDHDQKPEVLKGIVKWAFKMHKRFSCTYAKANLTNIDMEEACSSCIYGKENIKVRNVKIHSQIINELWKNKASLRHYETYLKLLSMELFGRSFYPEEYGLDHRTIRELCKLAPSLNRTYDRETKRVFIGNRASGNKYMLPIEFIENELYKALGEHLKHYLKLIIKGYFATHRYIRMRVGKENIRKTLGYKTLEGVYMLLKKLQELELAVVKKGYLVAMYYQPIRIINLNDYTRPGRAIKSSYKKVVGIEWESNVYKENRKENKRGENNKGSP